MTTRREFTQALAAAALAAPRWRDALAFAAKPTHLGPLGVQLYTVRDAMAHDVSRTLGRVRSIGYREVEFAGYFGQTPHALRAMLRVHGLSAPSCHVGLPDVTTKLHATLEAAKVIGHKWIILAWIDDADRTPAGYDRIADQLNRAGHAAHRYGIRVGYHNHDFEMVRWPSGELPLDHFASKLDPAVTDLETDLYWITKGGGDAKSWLHDHPGRIPLVHVKDAGPGPDFAMADVGAGAMDWRAIFAERHRAGIKHYFVEHDQPADPWASITASYQYLSNLTV